MSAEGCGSATSGEGAIWENLDDFTRSMHRWAQDDIQASFAAAAQAAQRRHGSGLRSIRLLTAGTIALLHLVGGELRAAERVAYEALAQAHTTEAAVLTGAQPPNPAAPCSRCTVRSLAQWRPGIAMCGSCLPSAKRCHSA